MSNLPKFHHVINTIEVKTNKPMVVNNFSNDPNTISKSSIMYLTKNNLKLIGFKRNVL